MFFSDYSSSSCVCVCAFPNHHCSDCHFLPLNFLFFFLPFSINHRSYNIISHLHLLPFNSSIHHHRTSNDVRKSNLLSSQLNSTTLTWIIRSRITIMTIGRVFWKDDNNKFYIINDQR